MSSVLDRWRSRLATRRKLLEAAERSVAYWARRAGSRRGRLMLTAAKARRALRRRQVAEAERVVARHATATRVTDRGVALVAHFEGFRSHPYRDPVGVWTIGYGETFGVSPHTAPVTEAYARARLRTRLDRDYASHVVKLARAVGLELRPRELDALASLVYNLGPGILARGRTMGDAIRSRDRRRIADAFLVYDKAGGRALPGLTARRRAERKLFLTGS